MNEDLTLKYKKLKDYLSSLGSVVIAFSSGVDSTFLLKTAHNVLKDKVIAVTASSCSFPKRELNEAIEFCRKENIKHIIFESEELDIEGFSHNPKNRCYLCKKELFSKISKIAEDNGINYVLEGSNTDDDGDYRPGMQAIKELGIISPLKIAGLSKSDIRILSKELKLQTWKKQSFACLSSRFVYGEEITKEKLNMVDKAEQLLLDFGFSQVRVRIHGTIARIEIMPDEFNKLIQNDVREVIVAKLKEFGFSYVSMDLIGYRTGSMNEVLNLNK